MKNIVFILSLCMLALTVAGQAKVLYTSADLTDGKADSTIKNVVPGVFVFSKNIAVHYRDGHKELVPKDSVWGYRTRKGKVYRLYEGYFYQLVKAAVPYYRYKRTVKYTYYYLSATLDRELLSDSRKHRRLLTSGQ